MTRPHLIRLSLACVLAGTLAGCTITTGLSTVELPDDASIPEALATELSSTNVLATAAMKDTARVAGVSGYVAVLGLLNLTAPCFGLSSTAARSGGYVALRVIATEVPHACATFAAGAFDYDVGVKGLAPGSYRVDVLHRVVLRDGRTTETRVGGKVVEVR